MYHLHFQVLVFLVKIVMIFFASSVSFVFANISSSSMEWIMLSSNKKTFIMYPSGKRFIPLGFNYDHDERGRLLEDYWITEWNKVVEDFREMKKLGANVVRIHLQFGKFMESPTKFRVDSINQLKRLINLAEELNLYIYLTGLGCYKKEDIPSWYNNLNEKERWDAQAKFWEIIASICAKSPAIFCYDLMNEPVVPGAPQTDWLATPFGDRYFVQFITLDAGDRPRPLVAKKWIDHLTCAIRKYDRRHLITIGLTSWSLDRPGITSGFVPEYIVDYIDFLSVHIYPETSKAENYNEIIKGFCIGKPLVVAEIFPIYCTIPELEHFILNNKERVEGWLSFYWGKEMYISEEGEARQKNMSTYIAQKWLESFRKIIKILKTN